MSDYVKGAKKPKKGQNTDNFEIGKIKLTYDLVIALLMAAFYAVFLLAAKLEGGLNAVLLSVVMFVAFVVFAYLMNAGTLKGLDKLRSLILVFLGLSTLSLAWELLLFFNVVDATKIGTIGWIAVVGILNAIISIIIIAGILYFEKIPLKELYFRAGDKLNIAMGVVGFVFCTLLAVGATYLVFGGSALGQDKLVQVIAAVLIFSVLGGIYEELWFRGLLLSRITPLIGESYGNIYQAAVFGAFEAVMFYTVTLQVIDLTVILLLGLIMGFYWGRSTLRTKSLLSPMLLHAGLYSLIMLPIIVGLLT